MGLSRTSAVVDGGSRVAAVVARHESTLLRVARQASLCHDDALDAYQRALEIFIRRVDTVEPSTEVAWLKVVVRHEAMAIRRARQESVTGEELDLDAVFPGAGRSVEDQIASTERVRRSAEALRSLKPDEATALMMKAHGLSYDEIGARNGWSYTKVNRAVTEGRRRFLRAYEGIESGEECDRFAPIVDALSAGSATAAQVIAIRPHLRHCTACRAEVRELHLSRLRRASLFFPFFAAPELPGVEDRLLEFANTPPRLEDVLEVPRGSLDHEAAVGVFAKLKQDVAAFFHRAQASDVATGVQIAVSGGGGRIATVGAILGICLSGGAGVATVCVVTGLVADPLGLIDRPAQREPERPRAQRPEPPRATPTPAPRLVANTPTPTPAPSPPPRRRRAAPSKDPSQGTKPTSHESPPITPAVASTTGQEPFTPEVPQAAAEPAPAPATGGGEFTP